MVKVLETAILEMGRKFGDQSFCPTQVAQWLYPQAWPHFMSDIHQTMMAMYREGKISVCQEGKEIAPDSLPEGPVRIKVMH
jgi:hypothetical protein